MIATERLESIKLDGGAIPVVLSELKSMALELLNARKTIDVLRGDIAQPSPDIQENVLRKLKIWPGLCAAGEWMNYPESKPEYLGGDFIVECEWALPGKSYLSAYFTEDGFKSGHNLLHNVKRFAEIKP